MLYPLVFTDVFSITDTVEYYNFGRCGFMKRMRHGKMLLGVPVLISGLSICIDKYFCVFISILMLFLCVSMSKVCAGHESIYCFVFIALLSIPINVEMTIWSWSVIRYIFTDTLILKLLYIPMFYIIILSFEEIVLGVIGRMIWRHQNDFFE